MFPPTCNDHQAIHHPPTSKRSSIQPSYSAGNCDVRLQRVCTGHRTHRRHDRYDLPYAVRDTPPALQPVIDRWRDGCVRRRCLVARPMAMGVGSFASGGQSSLRSVGRWCKSYGWGEHLEGGRTPFRSLTCARLSYGRVLQVLIKIAAVTESSKTSPLGISALKTEKRPVS